MKGGLFFSLEILLRKKHLQISATNKLFITISIVACAIGESVNPLQK
jgi:hypothetical protein